MKNKTKVEIWFQPGPEKLQQNYDPDEFYKDQLIDDYNLRNRLRLIKAFQRAEFNWDRCRGEVYCCWDFDTDNEDLKTKLKAMHAFDKHAGYPKAIKIGEFYE